MTLRVGMPPGQAKLPISGLVTHEYPGGSAAVMEALSREELDVGIVSTETVFFYSDCCIVGTYVATPRSWSLHSWTPVPSSVAITQVASATHIIGSLILQENAKDAQRPFSLPHFASCSDEKAMDECMRSRSCEATTWERFSRGVGGKNQEVGEYHTDYTTKWPGLCLVCKKGRFDVRAIQCFLKRVNFESWLFSCHLSHRRPEVMEMLAEEKICYEDFKSFVVATTFCGLPIVPRDGLEYLYHALCALPCKELFGATPQDVNSIVAPSCRVMADTARVAELSHWPSWPTIAKNLMRSREEKSENLVRLREEKHENLLRPREEKYEVCEEMMTFVGSTTAGIESDARSQISLSECCESLSGIGLPDMALVERGFHSACAQHHEDVWVNETVGMKPHQSSGSKAESASDDFHSVSELVECEGMLEHCGHSVYSRAKSAVSDDFHSVSELVECEGMLEHCGHSVYSRAKSARTDDAHTVPDMMECDSFAEECFNSVFSRPKMPPTDDFHSPDMMEWEQGVKSSRRASHDMDWEHNRNSVYSRPKTVPRDDYHAAREMVECEGLLERCFNSVYSRAKTAPCDDYHAAPELVECVDVLDRCFRSVYSRAKTAPCDDYHAPEQMECD